MIEISQLHINFYKIQARRDDILLSEESFPCQFVSVRKLRIKIIEHLQFRCTSDGLIFFKRYDQARLFDQLFQLFGVSYPIRLHNPGFCDICAQQFQYPAQYYGSMALCLNFVRQMKECMNEVMPDLDKMALIENRLNRIRFQCERFSPMCQIIFKFTVKDVRKLYLLESSEN